MALKTFNLDPELYKRFSNHCKKEGFSMSKKVENFLRKEIEKLEIAKVSDNNVPAVSEEAIALKVQEQHKNHYMRRYC